MIFIAVTTAMFVLSATTGVGRGVQFLADFSMLIAILLAVFLLVVGPTQFIISFLIESTGNYVYNFWPMTFRTGTGSQAEWVQSWTIYYWAWWISWPRSSGPSSPASPRGGPSESSCSASSCCPRR